MVSSPRLGKNLEGSSTGTQPLGEIVLGGTCSCHLWGPNEAHGRPIGFGCITNHVARKRLRKNGAGALGADLAAGLASEVLAQPVAAVDQRHVLHAALLVLGRTGVIAGLILPGDDHLYAIKRARHAARGLRREREEGGWGRGFK
jgi:hypothetical protein